MILASHLDYLRDKFIRTSWGNPSLETNIGIKPTLLNVKYPSYGALNVLRSLVVLPVATIPYDVYTLERVPPVTFKQNTYTLDKWISLTEFCTINNLLMYLSYGDELTSPLFKDTYIQVMSNGTVLLAVKSAKRTLRNKLNVYIRTSNDSLETDIDVLEQTLDTNVKVINWVSNYNTNANSNLTQYHINGVYSEVLNYDTIKVGDTVSEIIDTSVIDKHVLPVTSLLTYSYEGSNYYIINIVNELTNKIYTGSDCTMYLVNGGIGKRITMLNDEMIQLTNNKIAIPVHLINVLITKLDWYESNTDLTIYVKEAIPHSEFVNNDNYWYTLQQFDEDLLTRALTGTVEAPTMIKATSYHNNLFNQSLLLEYQDITEVTMSDMMSVATWDYYVNRTVVEADDYTNLLSDLLTTNNYSRVIASYTDGLLNKFKPNSKEDGNDFVRLGYDTTTKITNGLSIDISDMSVPAVYVKNLEEYTPLKQFDDYAIIDGHIEVKTIYKDVYGLDLASTYTKELEGDLRLFELPLSNALVGLGHVSLIASNGETLVPKIDYTLHFGKLVINYAKEVDNFKFIFQPMLLPEYAVVETGFTRNGSISINGSYLALDPSNHYIIVGGRIMSPKDVVWENEYMLSTSQFDNGVPYAVVNELLTNSTTDIEAIRTKRKEYVSNLEELAAFREVNYPIPDKPVSLYPSAYNLISIFFNEVYKAALADEIRYDRLSISAIGLSDILKDYLYLLDERMDISTHDLEWNIIDLRAHQYDAPQNVSSDLYSFLDLVNKTYLNNKVFMNTNFRISN